MDLHELLKTEMLKGKENIISNNKDYIEHYIMLDSYVKIKNSKTELGEYQWVFNQNGQNTNESIGLFKDLDYVIEIQIGSFFIPILEDITYMDPNVTIYNDIELVQNNNTPGSNTPPTLVRKTNLIGQYPTSIFLKDSDTYVTPWINNPYTQIPFFNRFTVQIKESNLQSYSHINNTRFNFEFEAVYNNKLGNNPNFVEAFPISINGLNSFTFIKPLRSMSTITLVFRNPDNVISFEPDVMYYSVMNITPDPIGGGGQIVITTQFPHKLRSGDRIFLKNFVPEAGFPDYLLNYIIRPEGHAVGQVIGTSTSKQSPGELISSPLSFSLDPSIRIKDLNNTQITESFPKLVDVYIAKRRLRIPLKIKCLKNKTDK